MSSLLRPLVATLWAQLQIHLLRAWLAVVRRDIASARELMSLALRMRNRRVARSACEALLRSVPDDVETIQTLAGICLQEGDARAAHALYVRHSRLLREPSEPKLYRNAFMVPELAEREEPYTHVVRDVSLETEYGAIFDDERVYVLETSGRNLAKHPYVRHRSTPNGEWFVVSCPDATKTIDERAVLLGTDGGTNYSHWLTRYVLKLALVEQARIPESVPLVLNENLRRYQIELLELLGIPPSRLLQVPTGTVVRCRELIVPVTLRNHAKMRWGIDWLRGRLAEIIEPSAQAGDLLFVSRRDSPNHVILNEADLEAALAKRGFRTIVLSEMSFADQVRSFARARVIVGGHGAGLTNLIFASPGATVVEVTSSHLHYMVDFRYIAREMGQQCLVVVSEQYSDTQPTRYHPNFNYYVDLGAVLDTVDCALGGQRVPRPGGT
jgi:capsular polysaccharide biosynthesis protein